MKYLFFPYNLKLLEALTFTNTLYAFDFDGTLAKIVNIKEKAAMSQKTKNLLSELAQIAPVAIVSGRSLIDLDKRANVENTIRIGNHGIEGFDSGDEFLNSIGKLCLDWNQIFLDQWLESLKDPYIELENKMYSLSLHYRRSRNKKRARERALQVIDTLKPKPRVIYGKNVINVMPAHGPHKGNAILDLLEKTGSKKVFYIGDDDTDESVFGMGDSRIFSVRVGESQKSKAMFFIKNQTEINKLLSLLIKFISIKSKKGLNYERSSHIR